MRTLIIPTISFFAGVALAGLLGFKVAIGIYYDAIIGKLSDNVTFYSLLEQGKPELTQSIISSSLDFFILVAEDSELSFWVSPSESDLQILAKAKQLQEKINLEEKGE